MKLIDDIISDCKWHYKHNSLFGWIGKRIVTFFYGNTQRFIIHPNRSLGIIDKRPILCKFLEWIESKLNELDKLYDGRYVPQQEWHTVFDWSMGVMLDSKEKALSVSRETGFERVDFHDWHVERKRQRKHIDDAWDKELQSHIKSIVKDVKQGRKFTHESRENREKIMKQNGIRKLPGANR